MEIGTQNRSADYGWSARDYIKSGKLGKVVMVKSIQPAWWGASRRTLILQRYPRDWTGTPGWDLLLMSPITGASTI